MSPPAVPIEDGNVDTVLATVLREGVANLLRHSKATRCTIRATTGQDGITLAVGNDGVAAARPSGQRPGVGLDNLAERLRGLGGRLETSVSPQGWFELTARLPPSQPA